MRGPRATVIALFASCAFFAFLADVVGCGSLLTLDPGPSSTSGEGDAEGAPPDTDGSFASDADASATDAPDDASFADSHDEPIVMGALSCDSIETVTDLEANCLAALDSCAHERDPLPEGGEPCIKTDGSPAGEKYCTSCVFVGVGGKYKYTYRTCKCE